jgi:hypothetical protein
MTLHDGYRELQEHCPPGCFVSINETVHGFSGDKMGTWYGCCIIFGVKGTSDYLHANCCAEQTIRKAVERCKAEWDELTHE